MTREERKAVKDSLHGLGPTLCIGRLYLAIWHGPRLDISWGRYSVEFCCGWLDEIATTPECEMTRLRVQVGFSFNLPDFRKINHRWKPPPPDIAHDKI